MKLLLQILLFFLTWFTNPVSATSTFTKVALPNYAVSFPTTKNQPRASEVKIGVSNFARSCIEERNLSISEASREHYVKVRIARAKDVKVVNGVGKIFNSIDEAVLAHIDDISTKLYRGDTRGIDDIFENGFTAKGTNTDLFDYVETNTPSVFIGTTKQPSIATSKFLKDKEGFVYIIDKKGAMTDVNNFYSAIGDINIHADELEVVIENMIPTTHIKGAFQIDINGNVIGDLISNPNYIP